MITIVKTQLNHNQLEVGLTTLWVLTHHPPRETMCFVVVQLSSNHQHNTDKSCKTKKKLAELDFRPNIFFDPTFSLKKDCLYNFMACPPDLAKTSTI